MEDNAAFAAKYNYPFPLLCDTDRSIGIKYGVCETPDAEHAPRVTYIIDADGRISQVYGKVNASSHPEELLATL